MPPHSPPVQLNAANFHLVPFHDAHHRDSSDWPAVVTVSQAPAATESSRFQPADWPALTQKRSCFESSAVRRPSEQWQDHRTRELKLSIRRDQFLHGLSTSCDRFALGGSSVY